MLSTHYVQVFDAGRLVGFLTDDPRLIVRTERPAYKFHNTAKDAELFMELAKKLQSRDGRSYKFDVITISTIPRVKPAAAFAFLPMGSK